MVKLSVAIYSGAGQLPRHGTNSVANVNQVTDDMTIVTTYCEGLHDSTNVNVSLPISPIRYRPLNDNS